MYFGAERYVLAVNEALLCLLVEMTVIAAIM